MGWASGSGLATTIEEALAPLIARLSPEEVMTVGEAIAGAFIDYDCDTLGECPGFIGDAASRAKMSQWSGTPLRPETGATAEHYGSWTFDGRRWRCAED